MPPTLNLRAPTPTPEGYAHVADEPIQRKVRGALCNSFGFGGMNASALFVSPEHADRMADA